MLAPNRGALKLRPRMYCVSLVERWACAAGLGEVGNDQSGRNRHCEGLEVEENISFLTSSLRESSFHPLRVSPAETFLL